MDYLQRNFHSRWFIQFIIAGFNVNLEVQRDAFAGNLWKTYTGLYVVGYLLAVLVLKFVYPLTKEKTEEMLQQLADKRNAANAE